MNFIEITEKENTILINVNQILFIQKTMYGSLIQLINETYFMTEENYEEVLSKLKRRDYHEAKQRKT